MKAIDFLIFLALLLVHENLAVEARAKGGGGESDGSD